MPPAAPTSSPGWPVSTYELSAGGVAGAEAEIYIAHPNHLGESDATGAVSEQARLRRFRASYITEAMHDAATRRGPLRYLFRRATDPLILARCREKSCFRRDTFSKRNRPRPPPTSHAPFPTPVDGVPYTVARSRVAAADAAANLDSALAADVLRGFSRPYAPTDAALTSLPTVTEAFSPLSAPSSSPTAVCDTCEPADDELLLVISYRHTTAKEGRILNIAPECWPPVLATITCLCADAGVSRFRLWTDQILSSRKPPGELRWVSCGVLPYAMYPVLYVPRGATRVAGAEGVDDGACGGNGGALSVEESARDPGNLEVQVSVADDLQRMWIAVEHLAAGMGQGILHAGDALDEDYLPREWPSRYITIGPETGAVVASWMVGGLLPADRVLRRVAGAIMCGLLRTKGLSWASDAHDIIDWASTIASSDLYLDIAHSFDCADCKRPFGYTGEHRLRSVMSSCISFEPVDGDEDNDNVLHPRLDVPAVCLSFKGSSWDGFREWIPESCLWGFARDESKSDRSFLTRNTQALLFSDGSVRAIAVLQLSFPYRKKGIVSLAHLLVGLTTTSPASRHHGEVNWSKRFWPVQPAAVAESFRLIVQNPADRNAVEDLAVIVGASSGLDYNDLSDAADVSVIDMDRVRWGD